MSDFKKITIKESVELSSPHPYALLVTKAGDEVNIMGVSWFTFVSMNPGKIAFSISNKCYTKEMIDKGAKAVLCLPDESIAEQAFACGKQTGRGKNKAEELGIKLISIDGFACPAAADSAVAWMLEVSGSADAGDHTLYIAKITDAAGNPDNKHLYSFDGYNRLDTVK